MTHGEFAAAESVDTIAAISTPPGRGGIGIVRLSGPQAAEIAAAAGPAAPAAGARPRAAGRRARWHRIGPDAEAARIDEALVTWFAAPNSYTAEDLVEIAAHGSPVVLELLLRRRWRWARGWPSRASSPSAPFSPAGWT
jgi:tRNA modification GTPase